MKRWQAVALAAIAVAVVLAGVGWLFRGQIALIGMRRLYTYAMSAAPNAGLPDGLHVALCGSGSPMPDPTRAGPCTAVLAGHRLFVIDAGAGSQRNLALMNLPATKIEALFLTHFHSDHIDGLGEMMLQRWAGGAHTDPMPVYGPTGVDRVLRGFQDAYTLDSGYRTAHHGPAVAPPSGFGGTPHPFAADPSKPNVTLIDEPDLKVIAFPVEHRPVDAAVGYLFIYKGRRVVISGDTSPSPRLEAAARDADVLVHEGLAPNLVAIQREAAINAGRTNLAAILHDILSYHTAPEAAAGIAERAHVKYLLFTHIIPPLPVRALEGPFLGRSRQIFHGPIAVGHDGDMVSLPAGGTEIHASNHMMSLFR